jgi:dihydroneopterin aldolase
MMAWMLADALGLDRRDGARETQLYRMVVRDLVLPCRIGIYDYEKRMPQRVRFNVELLVERDAPGSDAFGDVVNYEAIVTHIRKLAEGEHINLVETLAERIIDGCFTSPRVHAARVSVEKLDIYPEAESVGVVLRRRRRSARGAG